MSGRLFRIASLVVPPLLAAGAGHADQTGFIPTAARLLLVAWIVMASALGMRWVEAKNPIERSGTAAPRSDAEGRRAGERVSPWQRIDVLTPAGAAMMWLGAGAIVAAGETGWASLSVVGILGLGTVQIVAAWTAIVAGGAAMWRGAQVTRGIVPAIATEGEPVREEIDLAAVRIPAGMRLFVIGRAFRHGAVSRYAVDCEASRSKVKLGSELGPAPRGEHQIPPLKLWLGDVLGLTRTAPVCLGETRCTVLPRPGVVDGVKQLLGGGGDAMSSMPSQKMPTEGSFRIREYRPGDDTRRIHWVRSLQQDQLVVRLPDEIPISDPEVRVVLDTELFDGEFLTCRAVDELLDALVRVWLGIGRALDGTGARVMLVAAIDGKKVEQSYRGAPGSDALRLGARARWHNRISLSTLLGTRPTRTIVVSCQPRTRGGGDHVTWIAVPEVVWTSIEQPLPEHSIFRLPFPSGSEDNRMSRVRREQRRIQELWQDRTVFSQLTCWTSAGDYIAKPEGERIALAVIR